MIFLYKLDIYFFKIFIDLLCLYKDCFNIFIFYVQFTKNSGGGVSKQFARIPNAMEPITMVVYL